jgi:hypothetical protein
MGAAHQWAGKQARWTTCDPWDSIQADRCDLVSEAHVNNSRDDAGVNLDPEVEVVRLRNSSAKFTALSMQSAERAGTVRRPSVRQEARHLTPLAGSKRCQGEGGNSAPRAATPLAGRNDAPQEIY